MSRPATPPGGVSSRLPALLNVAFFAALGLWLFAPYIFDGKILFTNDAVLTANRFEDVSLWRTLLGTWRDDVMVGLPRYVSLSVPLVLRYALGAELWNNTIWLVASLLTSFAMLWILRLRRLGWIPAVLGALVAAWFGANFTFVYAGHTMKPFVVAFFVLALGFAHRLAVRRRWPDAVLLGACAGAMFMHQADVAFLFAQVLAVAVLVEFFAAGAFRNGRTFALIAASAGVCALLAAGPLLNGYRQFGEHIAVAESPGAKWSYMTQWSFPPEDVIAFVAPGYTGWKSTDPAGPYWGRMGRSAEDAPRNEQVWNLKIEDYYLGIVAFVFAAVAIAGMRGSDHRAQIALWTAVAVVSLLLAFGKYFPLYRLYFELPGISSIRNPNKFLHVFQVAMAMLAAFGAQEVFHGKRARFAAGAFFLVAALAAVWGWVQENGGLAEIQRLMGGGWSGSFAEAIVRLKVGSLYHLAAVSAAAGAVIGLGLWRGGRWLAGSGLAIAGLAAVDAAMLGSHYLQSMPRSFIASNALTDALRTNPQRTIVLDRKGVSNIWATYLLPYHGIDLLNVIVLPRMPADYARYFDAMEPHAVRLWQQTGTSRIVASQAEAERLVPEFATPVFEFSVKNTPDGPAPVAASEGEFSVLQLHLPAPRFALVGGARRENDALRRLSDESIPVFDSVFLAPGDDGPELDGHGIAGMVEVAKDEPNAALVRTDSATDSYLRVARRFDPDWKASIDGKPVELHRVDTLFQGVCVPAGRHEVALEYRPPVTFLVLQMLALALATAAMMALWTERRSASAAA